MKLFENKVGRPSNEMLKKRKIFYFCCFLFAIMAIVIGVFTLNHFNIINLKGSATYIVGDVTMDGIISEQDADLITQYVAGSKVFTDEELKIADFNKDGKVTSQDAKAILQSLKLNKKDAVRLYSTSVYSTSISKKSKFIKDGTYYIWNSTVRNGRIRIAKEKKHAGNIFRIFGWVQVDKIQKINDGVYSNMVTFDEEPKVTTTKRGDKKVGLGSQWNVTVSGVSKPADFSVTSSNNNVVYVAGTASNFAALSAVNPGRAKITIRVKSTGRVYEYNYVVSEYSPMNKVEEVGLGEYVKKIGTINGISVFSSCSETTVMENYKRDITKLEPYQKNTIKRIYFLDNIFYYNLLAYGFNTSYYNSLAGTAPNQGFSEIYVNCSQYGKEVLIHEVAHAIDNRVKAYKQIARYSDTTTIANLYTKYKSWTNNVPLRSESYQNKAEFFADAYATHLGLTNYRYENDIKNAMNQAINEIRAFNW